MKLSSAAKRRWNAKPMTQPLSFHRTQRLGTDRVSQGDRYHYGFVADDMDQAIVELKGKNAEILREFRDKEGKLTT